MHVRPKRPQGDPRELEELPACVCDEARGCFVRREFQVAIRSVLVDREFFIIMVMHIARPKSLPSKRIPDDGDGEEDADQELEQEQYQPKQDKPDEVERRAGD